jgi:hypothetical protein
LTLGCSRELFAQTDENPQLPSATAATAPMPSAAVVTPAVPSAAPEPEKTVAASTTESACNEQAPQQFLVDAHLNRAAKSRQERREQLAARAQSIAYRTRNYGRFENFGPADAHSQSPKQLSELTRFFGIPIVLNRRIVPALKCVEAALRVECASTPYQPQILSGIRFKNTYFDGEVSTHVHGIAIDVDPVRNPCCHCLRPWSESPRCAGKKTVWERMDMPQCWVAVFERYGFYWLGHDPLEDTMHFEFLGDPERIVRR